jgi:hypothetical protein
VSPGALWEAKMPEALGKNKRISPSADRMLPMKTKISAPALLFALPRE